MRVSLTLSAHAKILELKSPDDATVAVAPSSHALDEKPAQGR